LWGMQRAAKQSKGHVQNSFPWPQYIIDKTNKLNFIGKITVWAKKSLEQYTVTNNYSGFSSHHCTATSNLILRYTGHLSLSMFSKLIFFSAPFTLHFPFTIISYTGTSTVSSHKICVRRPVSSTVFRSLTDNHHMWITNSQTGCNAVRLWKQ
jgi:hypothetical protein